MKLRSCWQAGQNAEDFDQKTISHLGPTPLDLVAESETLLRRPRQEISAWLFFLNQNLICCFLRRTFWASDSLWEHWRVTWDCGPQVTISSYTYPQRGSIWKEKWYSLWKQSCRKILSYSFIFKARKLRPTMALCKWHLMLSFSWPSIAWRGTGCA